MRHRIDTVGGVGGAIAFALLLAGCGTDAAPLSTSTTTTTSPPVSTTQPSGTTTVTEAELGAQPLPAHGVTEPGDYYTTKFQPTVMYTVDTRPSLGSFQGEFATGFHRYWPSHITQPGIGPYKGVGVHNIWLGLTVEQVAGELADLDGVEIGTTTSTEVGGYPGTQSEAVVTKRTSLWGGVIVQGTAEGWFLQPGQRMRFIVLDTPAGSVLITIGADTEEWEDFLPSAQEILDGISFPDL